MACAPPNDDPTPELLAITTNTANICRGITTAYTVPSFALSLEEIGFITSDAKRSILGTTQTSPQEQCVKLLDCVEEQVRMDARKFESFVGIFSREAALKIYADLMIKAREIEAEKSHYKGTKRLPKPPVHPCGAIDQAIVDYGTMMRDLIQILDRHKALLNILMAFEHMVEYVGNKEYINIVQSKEYKEVTSVRTLFQQLAPYLKPPDCSLLKALVEVAGCEEAMQRLTEYLHTTKNNPLILKSSKPVKNPDKDAPILESRAATSATSIGSTGSSTTRRVLETEADVTVLESEASAAVVTVKPSAGPSTVPVTATVEVREMNWGMLRGIQSLICGIFRVPPFALQYDSAESGSVVIKWRTSENIASQMRLIMFDDGDRKLLLRVNVINIQVGEHYPIIVNKESQLARFIEYLKIEEQILPLPPKSKRQWAQSKQRRREQARMIATKLKMLGDAQDQAHLEDLNVTLEPQSIVMENVSTKLEKSLAELWKSWQHSTN